MKAIILILTVFIITPLVFCDEISLTIYNENLALVHEFRTLDFKKGFSVYDFTGIPSRIIPTSVHFRADGISVLEQNYEYDLASTDKISKKFIGEMIRIFTESGELFEGVLQPSDGGSTILIDSEGKVKVVQRDKIIHTEFPRMPENFLTKPTLVWQLESEKAGKNRSEISYLTEGMNWHAEYVAVTGREKLGFTGWVSIENNSGMEFANAKLKLMAGEIHRAERRDYADNFATMAEMPRAVGGAKQFEEKSFFEYHLYTLQRPATLKNYQIKQISLFPEAFAEFEQEYVLEAGRRVGAGNVQVFFKFKNSKKTGLGMPLPAGKIRVYQQDDDGSQEFIGEDWIKHTPRDEEVRIQVGEAFDIIGEKKTIDTRRISNQVTEMDFEISLRNRKDEPVEIIVKDNFYGDWTIIKSSHDFEQKDAYTAELKVQVPPHKVDEELLIRYTVRIKR